jgi:DNA modification methylase
MGDCHILLGDCRETLRAIPDGTVQTCVTSPPYFGLRDYGREGQLGLESTPDAFVAELVSVFREVRRVLRDDGTLWLNLGDSYAAQRGGTEMPAETLAGGNRGKAVDVASYRGRGFSAKMITGQESAPSRSQPVAHRNARAFGLKHKDLIGIPWRVAFALQADGWYLRSDIIWHKPNPMPESVTDRPTKSHEYIFLLSKSDRYYYDAAAIAEAAIHTGRIVKATGEGSKNANAGYGSDTKRGFTKNDSVIGHYRNRRSVWTVPTKPFKGAHFATFPTDLIEPCILAGSRVGDTVLDPFGGAGTTALVATGHGRRAILCELNAEYAEIAKARVGMFCTITTTEGDQ